MIVFVCLSVALVVLFSGAYLLKVGKLPDSISAMVYGLESPHRWIWILWMWAVSLVTCIPFIEVLPENWKAMGFLTLVCLGFVGAMPLVEKEKNTSHYSFGISAGILSQIVVAMICPWWLLLWATFPVCGILGIAFGEKSTLVAEIICYATMIGCLCMYI